MPRMSDAEKRKSHARILDAASVLFRERGIEATSVSDVMKAAGLTHGGFYRHFDSKEALVAAAFAMAVEEVQSDMVAASPGAERDAAREQYLSRYLSEDHIDDRARGCPLAALGAEIARLDGVVHSRASEAVDGMARLLGGDDAETTGRGIAMMALLLGTITLARLADTPDRAQAILEAGQRGSTALQQQM